MQDTSEAANRRYYELLAQKSPAERLEIAIKLSEAVRGLTMAGIQAEDPEASPEEQQFRFVVRTYGREFALRFLRRRA